MTNNNNNNEKDTMTQTFSCEYGPKCLKDQGFFYRVYKKFLLKVL